MANFPKNFGQLVLGTLSEQIARSTVDLHLKEISEFLHGSVMNKDFTLPHSQKEKLK